MKNKKRRLKKKYRAIFSLILFLVFFVSASSLVYIKYNKYQEQKSFEELEKRKEELKQKEEIKENKQEETKEEQQIAQQTQIYEEEQTVEEELVILPEYEELYKENSDLYGWIKIDDTVIDYPVMHTPKNTNYYIHRNWEKEESNAGTPFVDVKTVFGETENTIIYAHNMKNRTMFGSLREYKDKTYYENHKYIQFDTIYEKAEYEIVAISKAVVYYQEGTEMISASIPKTAFEFYNYVELDTAEKFDEYIAKSKENAYFETGVTAEYGDKLITLCTCDYWTENARLLVIAKKIE